MASTSRTLIVVLVGLCLGNDPETGEPFSKACQSGAKVPWIDAEQMGPGEKWENILYETQTDVPLSIFFGPIWGPSPRQCTTKWNVVSFSWLLVNVVCSSLECHRDALLPWLKRVQQRGPGGKGPQALLQGKSHRRLPR